MIIKITGRNKAVTTTNGKIKKAYEYPTGEDG